MSSDDGDMATMGFRSREEADRYVIGTLRKELKRVRAQLDALVNSAVEVIAISDRKHDAWDRLKASIDAARGKK